MAARKKKQSNPSPAAKERPALIHAVEPWSDDSSRSGFRICFRFFRPPANPDGSFCETGVLYIDHLKPGILEAENLGSQPIGELVPYCLRDLVETIEQTHSGRPPKGLLTRARSRCRLAAPGPFNCRAFEAEARAIGRALGFDGRPGSPIYPG